MPYASADLTQVMGLGSYVGEVREGPDGQLYEWVEGVDGLGNPIGFWRGLRRAFQRAGRGLVRFGRGALRAIRPFARMALPFTKFIPGVGPAIYAAGSLAQRAGLLGVGEVAQGPDGQLYEYVEGVDGLGNPIGFWRQLRRAAGGLLRRATGLIPGAAGLLPGAAGTLLRQLPGVQQVTGAARQFCQVLPRLQPCLQQFPATMPAYQAATRVCGALRSVGLAGAGDGVMEAPDGQLYEVVEGVGPLGEARPFHRRVWVSIPAVVRPRGSRLAARPRRVMMRPVPGAPPSVVAPAVRAVRRFR
jgi:hypothetical protein